MIVEKVRSIIKVFMHSKKLFLDKILQYFKSLI